MSRAALWAFKARVLTRPRSVYETPSVFERKQRPDKSHGALNQWPVLRRHNCLFTASSKSILAFPSPIHPYRYGADSGCLAAAVLELFLFVFSCFCDWSATKSAPSLSFFFFISAWCRLALMVKDSWKVNDVFYLRGAGRTQDGEIMNFVRCCFKGVCPRLYSPEAICMYPARVQILLSHPPLGRKMVMMANRELTASRAQPPEQSTALVWRKTNAI